jgi:hypothetical protein
MTAEHPEANQADTCVEQMLTLELEENEIWPGIRQTSRERIKEWFDDALQMAPSIAGMLSRANTIR